MPTSTSLNLRALLKTALAASGMDASGREVSGLSGQARALFAAARAHAMPRGVVLHIVPSDADLEQAVGDARFFLAALDGLSDAAAERAVLSFPSHEIDPYRGLAPHLGVASARARALHAMASGSARLVVASAPALVPRVSAPARIASASIDLRAGRDIAPADLAARLVDAGFSRDDPADERGEFVVRGGIVDIFPAGEASPVRLEFMGDTIESMRRYDPATQRSVATIDQAIIVPLRDVLPVASGESDAAANAAPSEAAEDRSATVFDYLAGAAEARVLVSEPDEVDAQGVKLIEQWTRSYDDAVSRREQPVPLSAIAVDWTAIGEQLARATHLRQLAVGPDAREIRCQPITQFAGRLPDWVADIQRVRETGETVLFVAATAGRAERTVELLREYGVSAAPIDRSEEARYAAVLVTTGPLSRGFRLTDARLHVYAEGDVFDEERRAADRRRSVSKVFLSDLRDLKVGDYVVHVDHGIGVFVGLKQIGIADAVQEFLQLQYAGDDKLFVPVERLDLVQKYSGASRPPVDRLGGASWERAKTRVKKAMRDMAEELLKLYATRKAAAGHAFSADTHWQKEFEDAFEYELTTDQRTAIADIKRDMETPTPMDRLLCGDVGYGKTEVAMRAAFKAVMDGKQVAVLAPTTVLAFQHEKTFSERFAGFPVRIDMVSRFRSKAEQTQVLADLSSGKVDIIIGTHRLLSKDVRFRDLGLLVVDEEQRFGVAHKEQIKRLRRTVDVLTMSATPIPRTLNMSLVGIRDMSIIETPPKDRLAIQTHVVRFDQQVINRAIRAELDRGGQIYFVHNRVESIFSIGHLLQRLVPEAKVVVAHGQMSEAELERAMLAFMARQHDVLLATTIVENGLDIPNANTIIINRADRYGLSQLYQLRGRVGRSDRPAYAYLLIPPEDNLSPIAKKRLAAMKEFSDLGSGFRVAALDLEIRGAGNLLGGEQSGHIDAVGFEMYMKLLEQTVRDLKGEESSDETRATVNLGVDLRIDVAYVPDMNQRLILYRNVAAARDETEIASLVDEAADRYGPPPAAVLNLADYGRIRVMADRIGVESLDREAGVVVIKFGPHTKVDPVRLVALVRERGDLTLVPPAALRIDLKGGRDAGGSGPPARRGRRAAESAPSWWTARAREREVRPGFTKADVLRPERDDPRAPGGLFERIGAVLSALGNDD